MANKKDLVPIELNRDAQDSFIQTLETDIKYSLDPDPDGKLKLSTEQKNFLRAYIEFKSIPLASQLTEIDEKTGQKYFLDPKCRAEIRRINLALYYRKFSRRLLSIDEIGGYLTSMLVDEDVPEDDKLGSKDKLQVAKLIIELNKLKTESFNNPKIIESVDFEEHVQDLDVDQLKQLIETTRKPNREEKKNQQDIDALKTQIINELNVGGYFDPSEIAYLKSCSLEELQKLKADNDSAIKRRNKDDT